MSHIRIDAPKGFVYRRKGSLSDFSYILFIGHGRSIDDYELISEFEYQIILAEQEKADKVYSPENSGSYII